MFKVQDFNPIFKTPTNSNIPQNPPTQGQSTHANININSINSIDNTLNSQSINPVLNNSLIGSFHQSNNPSTPSFANNASINQGLMNDERLLTFTNYYKFCCLSNINCYFYQFNTQNFKANTVSSAVPASASTSSSSSAQSTVAITYEVLQYEQLIKQKLENDYQIKNIITWIAKKELCVFQLNSETNNENTEDEIGFNQLKDAMSNIISENNISLKLISASSLDANKLFMSTTNATLQIQMQKKSLNVIYLSFLRAVHKYIVQKMANSHCLFDATNQSLFIDIVPYSGHLMTSSLIQRSTVTTHCNNETKKKKILKKLVPYSILKVNPSLNQKNEVIVNMTSLKKVFYKLTDYLAVSCGNKKELLDKNASFAIYIAPSGIRCVIAGESVADSITEEMPENYERLFKVLKKFNDIDIVTDPTTIDGKRLWIKLHPSGFGSGNNGPLVADYLNKSFSTGKKFIHWPLELCFIQFASDSTPGKPQPSNTGNDCRIIDDPLGMVDEFIDVMNEINQTKSEEYQPVKCDTASETKPEFKLSENFEFSTNLDSLENSLKPLVSIDEIHGSENNFDDIFNNHETKFNNSFQTEFESHPQTNANVDHTDNINDLLINDKKIDGFEEDWDGLFGDSAEDEENNVSNDSPKFGISKNTGDSSQYDIDRVIDSAIEELERDAATEESSKSERLHENHEGDCRNSSEEGVSKIEDGLCSTFSNSLEKNRKLDSTGASLGAMSNGSFYEDPGAPSPIAFQIFTPETESKKTQKLEELQRPENANSDLLETKKSLFSPLNFNPLIEKDIDSKYSNGGKFFVNKNDMISSETLNPLTSQAKRTCQSTPHIDRKLSFTTPYFNTHGFNKIAEIQAPLINDDIFSDSDEYDGNEDDFSGVNQVYENYKNLGNPHDSKFPDINSKGSENHGHHVQSENKSADPNLEFTDTSVAYPDNTARYDGMNIYEQGSGNGLSSNKRKNREILAGEDVGDLGNTNNELNKNIFQDLIDVASTETGALDFQSKLSPEFSGKDIQDRVGTGLGITVSVDSNPAKRRKLESIFDSIGRDDEDDMELDFEDEATEEHSKADRKMVDIENYLEAKDGNTPALLTLSSDHVGQTLNTIENIEIPNSWFYVLRLVAPIQIPFNFLASGSMAVSKSKIESILPILQEYVLFSQKYLNNSTLDIFVNNRECPSVLDTDVEYLLYKIFPGISKVPCFELLDSTSESFQRKPYECLFGTHVPENLSECTKVDKTQEYFDDDEYGIFSPIHNGDSIVTEQDHVVDDFKRLGITDNIPNDNLFRLGTPVVNLKRFDEEIMIKKVGLEYWRMLNLEPSLKKNFNILFAVPKTNSQFNTCCKVFLDSIVTYYNDCKLGTIDLCIDVGIVEIDYGVNCTKADYWDNAKRCLLAQVENIQSRFRFESMNKILLLIIDPFQDLESLVQIANVTNAFEAALSEKSVIDTDTKKKKKKKGKVLTKIPMILFYKAISIDTFYMNEGGQFVVFTMKNYINFCVELYNICPNEDSTSLKDRKFVFTIEKEIQDNIDFSLTKKQIAKPLIEDEMFLHLCYERSIDRKWCVSSWVDQTGNINFTKSWFIDSSLDESKNFQKVADDIMEITANYVAGFKRKTYVVLSRLNNIIPDDELAEWKRLSIKNSNILPIVVTAEIESSTLILSNNPGVITLSKVKENVQKDPGYTIASTASQSQTPAYTVNESNKMSNHVLGSGRLESPDVSLFTPSFDIGLSPMDAAVPQVQAPIQTLHPLHEEDNTNAITPPTPVLVDIADECYGLIFQVAQPLANQPRIPLKTGFLVSTGDSVTKNHILEINLLSCQAGISSNKFMKKLIVQYRKLSLLTDYLGMVGIERDCGMVDFEDIGDDDDDDEYILDEKWTTAADSNSIVASNQFSNERAIKRKEKLSIQQQYLQFHRMQLSQKRHKMREKEKEGEKDTQAKHKVIPIHMLAVRKMLDFLVNIKVNQ